MRRVRAMCGNCKSEKTKERKEIQCRQRLLKRIIAEESPFDFVVIQWEDQRRRICTSSFRTDLVYPHLIKRNNILPNGPLRAPLSPPALDARLKRLKCAVSGRGGPMWWPDVTLRSSGGRSTRGDECGMCRRLTTWTGSLVLKGFGGSEIRVDCSLRDTTLI